jgi:microcompartment protein CcmL/EutN
MVVKFQGNAGAVQSALDAGVEEAKRRGLYITSKMIAGLDDQVQWFADLTATGKDKLRGLDSSKKSKK